MSSSSINSAFNFKFIIPKEIYEISNTTPLTQVTTPSTQVTTPSTQVSDKTLKLTITGEAVQQVFVDIAYNFVKAINVY